MKNVHVAPPATGARTNPAHRTDHPAPLASDATGCDPSDAPEKSMDGTSRVATGDVSDVLL
jgi:hypothetical protein